MEISDPTAKRLKGFLRVADVATKNIIFHSEKQLEAFANSSSNDLGVDTTGAICIEDKNGKKYFYYSLIYQDKDRSDAPMPLSGMINQSNCTQDIGQFLSTGL